MEPIQNTPSEPVKRSGSKKPLLVIVLIIIIAGGYFLTKNKTFTAKAPGPVQEIIDQTNLFVSKLPELNQQILDIKPKDRKIPSVDASNYEYSSSFGYQFKTPFGVSTISATSSTHEFVKELEYANGKKLVMSCISDTPRTEFTRPGSGAYFASDVERDAFLEYTGDVLDSGFRFTELLLSANPDEMNKLRTESEAMGYSKLVAMKVYSLSTADPIYRFKTDNVQGFQFGDYSKPSKAHIALFPKGDTKCDIYADEAQGLSQADVDLIISTFGPKQ